MKLVKPSYEILEQQSGIIGMKKFCERAGRLCYKSEGSITDDSYKKLLATFDAKGHYSPLAHGTVYLIMNQQDYGKLIDRLNATYWNKASDTTFWDRFHNEVWTRIVFHAGFWYITTNYRVIKELGIEDIMEQFWSEPQCWHIRRYSVHFRIAVGIARELLRHSVALCPVEQSTRYCNFAKDKFGNEVSFVEPSWLDTLSEEHKEILLRGWETAESAYFALVNNGVTPEKARDILPLGLYTETILTGFPDSWEHVFNLRTTKAAHPDMVAIMKPLAADMYNRGFITKKYE